MSGILERIFDDWQWRLHCASLSLTILHRDKAKGGMFDCKHLEDWMKLIHPEDRSLFFTMLTKPDPTAEHLVLEYRLKLADVYHHARHQLLAVKDDEQQIVEWVGVVGPAWVSTATPGITNQDKATQNAMTDRMATIGMLAAGVAHEINNPLSYILSNLKFSIDTVASSRGLPLSVRQEIEEPLQDALDGAEKVRVIVKDLRTFARPDTQDQESIDVRSVMESAINLSWNEIRHRARLTKQFDDVPMVRGAESRLAQVFLNLLINAAHAITPGFASQNVISLSIKHEANQVVVRVTDSGCGIELQAQDRIFEPFFTTKSRHVGTGLGLAICRQYLEQMHGEISFTSEEGKGTEFVVRLPSSDTKSIVCKPKIVAIDDDMNVLKSLRRMLSNDYEVFTFQQGSLALDSLASLNPQLILCDVAMPDMPGEEVYAALRNQKSVFVDKFAFITGSAFQQGVRKVLKDSTRPYLEKPFDAGAVRSLLDVLKRQHAESDKDN